jgi:putative PIN family toxin of toxin-antitoxin system
LNRPRVVFDAVVYVQALIGGRGPAAACIHRALSGDVIVFLSDALLAEIAEVPLRPELTRRYPHLTTERVAGFLRDVQAVAVHVASPSRAFTLPRDSKDEPYTDLAIAVDAAYLVTWNHRHLTYLMQQDTAEGRDFCRRFPFLRIVSPPEFLQELARLNPPEADEGTRA